MNAFWRNNPIGAYGIPLISRNGWETAEKVISGKQMLMIIGGIFTLLTIGWVWGPLLILVWLTGSIVAVMIVLAIFKFVMAVISAKLGPIKVTDIEIAVIDDADLPVVTVLVPLHKEKQGTIRGLKEALKRLDWPIHKLEVFLLIREEDEGTLSAAAGLVLPLNFRVLKLPSHHPKLKPSALNIGLAQARGDYIIIYDAESRPEADQLKKSWIAFTKSPDNVFAIQSKTSIRNPDDNPLTSVYASEYSTHYILHAPGLCTLNLPVPMSGHSVLFKAGVIKQLGGWDPWNVTEDCELGIRAKRAGFGVQMVDSTTWEEAPVSLTGQWFAQRKRWKKGFIQTWLVNMRTPLKFIREVGIVNFLSFQFTVGVSVLIPIVNPFFWATTILWYFTDWNFIRSIFPGPVFYAGLVSFILGNMYIFGAMIWSVLAQRHYKVVKYIPFVPLYWLAETVATGAAFIETGTAPHAWGEPTAHGLIPEESTMEEVAAS